MCPFLFIAVCVSVLGADGGVCGQPVGLCHHGGRALPPGLPLHARLQAQRQGQVRTRNDQRATEYFVWVPPISLRSASGTCFCIVKFMKPWLKPLPPTRCCGEQAWRRGGRVRGECGAAAGREAGREAQHLLRPQRGTHARATTSVRPPTPTDHCPGATTGAGWKVTDRVAQASFLLVESPYYIFTQGLSHEGRGLWCVFRLRASKFFDCCCPRCADPSEAGLELGSLVCPQCRSETLTCSSSE